VSHATVASYEKGVTSPGIDVLAALASLYERPINWFLESRDCFTGFRFRQIKPRVKLAEQRQFEALANKWAEAYFKLDKHLNTQKAPIKSPGDLPPEQLAESVRREILNLDDDSPVQNAVEVLERFSAWAFELRATFEVEGAAAKHGNNFVVVFNPHTANDRLRLTAALELGHVLYRTCDSDRHLSFDAVERRAAVFATTLLMPDSQLAKAFEGKSFLKLIEYKERFGIALSSMIFRAEQMRMITTTTSRWLWGEMCRRGWKDREPGYVWRDRAVSFEKMLESAIHTKRLTWGDAERVTGICAEELRNRIWGVFQVNEPTPDEAQATIRFMPGTAEDVR